MPPCCQLRPGPAGSFALSLEDDARRFSAYIGDGSPKPQTPPGPYARFLTGGLHLEMKLWTAQGFLPRIYKPNNPLHNAFRASYPQRTRITFTLPQRTELFNNITSNFPKRSACANIEYDRWILKEVLSIRAKGLLQPGAVGIGIRSRPTTLVSIGMAQKLLNIYVKHVFCWQIVGQWQKINKGYTSFTPPFSPGDFLCSLHAPIDNIVLERLLELPIGKYLEQKGLLKLRAKKSVWIYQALDGLPCFWSRLNCLRTYYGFQLIFRRIAMSTWLKGCACSASPKDAIEECASMFKNEFACGGKYKGSDWIQIALNIPDEIIAKTIDGLGKASPAILTPTQTLNPKLRKKRILTKEDIDRAFADII